MKKLILICSCLLVFKGIGFAQDLQNASQGSSKLEKKDLSKNDRIKNQMAKVEKELGLNADQKLKWQAASKERMESNQPLRLKLNGSTTPEERKQIRQQLKANNNRFDQEVSAFLNPDQKTKLDSIKKQKHADMAKRRIHKDRGDKLPEVIKE